MYLISPEQHKGCLQLHEALFVTCAGLVLTLVCSSNGGLGVIACGERRAVGTFSRIHTLVITLGYWHEPLYPPEL